MTNTEKLIDITNTDEGRKLKRKEWLTTAQLSGMQGWVEDNEKENGDDLT